jgi:hypothetical protein
MSEAPRKSRVWSWWYLLLIVQLPLALWVGFYNVAEPTFIGLPFFYWFQMASILIAAVLTAIVYFATEREEAGR